MKLNFVFTFVPLGASSQSGLLSLDVETSSLRRTAGSGRHYVDTAATLEFRNEQTRPEKVTLLDRSLFLLLRALPEVRVVLWF